MPAKFAAQDFRNYIKTNFVLEGNKTLSDRHLKELGKTLAGHATLGRNYHAGSRAALIYGKHAAPVSEQRALALTKHLVKAAKLGEVEVDGKKLQIEREFKQVRGQGQLQESVREMSAETQGAKKDEPTVEVDKNAEVRKAKSILQHILGVEGTPVAPGRMKIRNMGDTPMVSAQRIVQKVVSASDVKTGQVNKVPAHFDPTLPMVSSSIGKVQRTTTSPSTNQTIAPRTLLEDQTLSPSPVADEQVADIAAPPTEPVPTDSVVPVSEPAAATEDDANDNTPPPAADDEMMI